MNANPICIIDDDEDVRAVMSYALEFEGIPTLPLRNAQSAVEYLKTLSPAELPCLIIVDYMMEGMNGFEFINYIRTYHPHTLGKIPLAISSGSAFNASEVPAGVTVLTKPVELRRFLEVAKRYYPGLPQHHL